MVFALIVGVAALLAMVYAPTPAWKNPPGPPEAVVTHPSSMGDTGQSQYWRLDTPDARANPHHVRVVPGESASLDRT
jgi:hypothetical protein